jgi:hypothetical protein
MNAGGKCATRHSESVRSAGINWVRYLRNWGRLAEPVHFDYFAPETRIDSVLSAQLQSIIHLIAQEDYRQAAEQATQAAATYDDSIQLDFLTLAIRRRALARALKLNQAPDKDHAQTAWTGLRIPRPDTAIWSN